MAGGVYLIVDRFVLFVALPGICAEHKKEIFFLTKNGKNHY